MLLLSLPMIGAALSDFMRVIADHVAHG
jgi:hypothetical protein